MSEMDKLLRRAGGMKKIIEKKGTKTELDKLQEEYDKLKSQSKGMVGVEVYNIAKYLSNLKERIDNLKHSEEEGKSKHRRTKRSRVIKDIKEP